MKHDAMRNCTCVTLICRYPNATGFCFFYDFFELFKQLMEDCKISSHLWNSCQRLRIVAIVRENIEDELDISQVIICMMQMSTISNAIQQL